MNIPRNLVTGLCAALLAACASGDQNTRPAAYSADGSPGARAAEWVDTKNHGATPDRLAITACSVAFGTETSGSDSTSAGMLTPSSEQRGRVDAKVNQIWLLEGLDTAGMQQLTDRLCAGARDQLAAAGFTVLPAATVAADKGMVGLREKGKPSPMTYEQNKSVYTVFAPSGGKVTDPKFTGTATGFKAALAAAKGDSVQFLENGLVDRLDAASARIQFIVDFASVGGEEEGGFLSGLTDDDDAEVTSDIRLSVNAALDLVPKDSLSCNVRFGNRECYITEHDRVPSYWLKRPMISDAQFYTELVDRKTTGDKVGETVANVVGFLAAAAGGKGTSYNLDKTGVVVNRAVYERVVRSNAGDAGEMLATRARH